MFAFQPCVENAPLGILAAEIMVLRLLTDKPVTITHIAQALN